MRKLRSLLALLLCAALLLGLLGCGKQEAAPTPTEAPTEPSTEAPTEPPVSNLYTEALQPLLEAENLQVDLTTKKTVTVGTEVFEHVSDQELILTGIGTESFAASMTEELEVGDCYDEFTEYFADGVLYVNIFNTGRFQGSMTEEEFLARFAPTALLDKDLYADITAEETNAGTTLTFADPSAPESWALPEGAEFVSAGGTAKVNENGTLTRTAYTLEYTQGNTTVSMEVISKAEVYDGEELKAPMDPTVYKQVASVDALRLYDTAIVYLYAAETVSSEISQTTVSQAAACTLSEITELHYTGSAKEPVADIKYLANIIESDSGQTESFLQTEHFEDGTYTYCEAGGTPEPNPQVTWEDMFYYLQSCYDSNLPALEYITSAKAEEVAGLIYLEIELDDAWGKDMSGYAAYQIFGDPEFLNNHASDYETTGRTYYMAVDPGTGFPLSAGTAYSGIHTIDGMDCLLAMEITQTFRVADPGAYEAITGKALPEEEPETRATPLLYRVTGKDGQEMYLMGTIHAGDTRTTFLPDEVYYALANADALAVEADIMDFEEKLENDLELAGKMAAAYLNADGAATKDQLDADVYEKAVKLLKISGSYIPGMEYMKPYLWSSSIENFFLSLGSLRADHGMDMRLLKLAKEQGKEIIEVESSLEQIEMFADFSPALQEMLLEETIGYTAAEFCREVEDLYELWCQGDEAALRAKLEEVPEGLTDEEKKLYDEYLDAMIIRRNERMLDDAIACLESGDTVFYAVGLAHLLQENGLVYFLRDAGYTVEQVIYS